MKQQQKEAIFIIIFLKYFKSEENKRVKRKMKKNYTLITFQEKKKE